MPLAAWLLLTELGNGVCRAPVTEHNSVVRHGMPYPSISRYRPSFCRHAANMACTHCTCNVGLAAACQMPLSCKPGGYLAQLHPARLQNCLAQRQNIRPSLYIRSAPHHARRDRRAPITCSAAAMRVMRRKFRHGCRHSRRTAPFGSGATPVDERCSGCGQGSAPAHLLELNRSGGRRATLL